MQIFKLYHQIYTNKMFLKTKCISFLKNNVAGQLLKDHVTLTEVMAAEISALHHRNKLHLKIDLHLFNNYLK